MSGLMMPTSSNEQVTFAQNTESKFASVDEDTKRPPTNSRTEVFDINKEQLLKMLASQANRKDKQSHSFLSKFSLLSSKTTIGESGQSIDKKKELRGAAARSPKGDFYRPPFVGKKA